MTNIISAVGITDVLTQKNIHLDLLLSLKELKGYLISIRIK